MPPHQSGAAQSASTECLIGDPMHLMEKPIDCFNIVSGERIFDDRPNLLKSFSWSHGSPRHQAASASRGTMEAARWEVFWHLHLTLLSGRRDWSTRPHCGRHAGGEGGIRTHERVTPLAVFKTAALNHSATSPSWRRQQLISNSLPPSYLQAWRGASMPQAPGAGQHGEPARHQGGCAPVPVMHSCASARRRGASSSRRDISRA